MYIRSCFGALSPSRVMRPGWASGSRGGGVEHSQFFGTSAESSGSVARTIAVARRVSHPELDLLDEGLAVSGETFARRNSGLRLKESTEQFFRIMAKEPQ